MTGSKQVQDYNVDDHPLFRDGAPTGGVRLSATVYVFFLTNAFSWSITTAVPALYSSFENQFALTALELSALRALLTLCQYGTAPVWAMLCARYSRRAMLWNQCFLLSVFCLLIMLPDTYPVFLCCMAGLGVANGGVAPIIQSIIADLYPPEQRGRLYGLLNVATFLGVAFGFVFPTNVPYQILVEETRLRVVFLVLGCCFFFCGLLILIIAREPPRTHFSDLTMWTQIKAIASSKTWVLIVLQGCFSSVPWDAISFLILLFEMMGFGRSVAGIIMLFAAIGAATGAIFGGWLGDKAARWSPNKGRLAMAQFSLIMSLPLSYLYLRVIYRSDHNGILFSAAGFLMGFFCNWVGSGCNEVIISEVVLPEHRTVAFSVDRLLDGMASAMGSIFVGGVAQLNGYEYAEKVPIPALPMGTRITNVDALADALTLCCFIFCLVAAIINLFISRYYAGDRDRILSTPRVSVYSVGYSPITIDAI